MSTRKLTEIAQELLDEASGKRKQSGDVAKLVNKAIQVFAKSEENKDSMLDLMVLDSSISNGNILVRLVDKNSYDERYGSDEQTYDFVLNIRPHRPKGVF